MSAIGVSDYILETVNLFYTGHIEPQTWFKQISGTTRSGLILRDVSLEVHSGEIMAILGSKGSGKKALLDVISCRAYGPRKGYILLNGVTLNRRLFQTCGSYLSGVADEYLQEGLSVYQVLHYEASLSIKVPPSVRKIRVRQIMSDIALTQHARTLVENLTVPERRRLSLGMKLLKDPVILLADEPAWNLDPLNTYFIVSILSNYGKKYGRIVILTMEKPRSDIFPFLDRVSYLCLGDVVYSGNTRLMLDYFRNIGFPCPEVENPLMYYLCLSTVDRRSHERYIESNNQIGLLVDKFKIEGNSFRKAGGNFSPIEGRGSATPLHALGKPSTLSSIGLLIMRNYASTFTLSWTGLEKIFFQLAFLPFLFFILWIYYFGAQNSYQHAYVTQNGLVLNILAVTYFASIWITILTFGGHRDRYYQESRDGLYSGPKFILSYTLATLPYNIITTLIASRIAFECTFLTLQTDWLLLFSILFGAFTFAQQQTFSILLFTKRSLIAASFLSASIGLCLVLGSGTVRTMRGLPDWLYYLTYITQQRYAGGFLNEEIFSQYSEGLPVLRDITRSCSTSVWSEGCVYVNGTRYLEERYYNSGERVDLNYDLNFGLTLLFPVLAFITNLILYALPLPAIIKTKFRE